MNRVNAPWNSLMAEERKLRDKGQGRWTVLCLLNGYANFMTSQQNFVLNIARKQEKGLEIVDATSSKYAGRYLRVLTLGKWGKTGLEATPPDGNGRSVKHSPTWHPFFMGCLELN